MRNADHGGGRRDFLRTAAAGAAGAALWPARPRAAELSPAEQANLKLVNDFCAVWAAPMDTEKLRPFLADGCSYRPTESTPARTGSDIIIASLGQFAGDATFCEFEVVESFARGSLVVNERWDRFTLPSRTIEWHGVGVFYIVDGSIAEWSDFTIL